MILALIPVPISNRLLHLLLIPSPSQSNFYVNPLILTRVLSARWATVPVPSRLQYLEQYTRQTSAWDVTESGVFGFPA